MLGCPLVGRHSHPVVRLGFKPSWERQPLPGRFDSGCLPPLLTKRSLRGSEVLMSTRIFWSCQLGFWPLIALASDADKMRGHCIRQRVEQAV